MFFFKSTITFFLYDEHDHIIDLMSNKFSFFEFLYIMFQKKLKFFQKYICENFALIRIKYSIVDINTSILFIFKKNEILKFCVNYKNLNAITIKNKISLSLIDETLNRLMNIAYFIKLNLKNAYYRIKIKTNDE